MPVTEQARISGREMVMMVTQVDNTADVLDSREIVERVAELRDSERLSEAERAELGLLDSLLAELRDVGDDSPEDGLTLVRDSYFVEYAQELAEEMGVVPSEYTWPVSCIDWAHAARELRMDYTPVEFGGVTYWVR